MSSSSLVLWQSAKSAPIAARIAVAGDFLPAGALSLPAGGWSEAARGAFSDFDEIDLSFVNLECPLDTTGLPARPLAGLGAIVSAPSASLDYLKCLRSLVVSVANNHSYDFGDAGIERTRVALARRGLVPIGAGRTLRGSPEVSVWQGPADVRVGFWAAARASRDLASRNSPGVEPATPARARRAASVLKSLGARFSIALLHCGCLRTNRPDPSDVALMDSIAASGFGIVAASHSHRISGSKVLSTDGDPSAFCFYGLGSIVSGYVASPLEREGLAVIAGLHLDGTLAGIEVRPVWLSPSGFGETALPDVCRSILNRYVSLSTEIADGSSARHFYDDMAQGLVGLYARDARAAFRQSGLLGLARKVRRIRVRHLLRLLHGVTS
jgi:Bacterial capsule synthesis protein PGA_cap